MTIDFFGVPNKFLRGDVQVFTAPASVTNLQWQTWRKPRGVSMMSAIVLGGGGGGGAGFTRAAAATGGGGGGGASAGLTRVTYPTIFLPDVLYVQVGVGGFGGIPGGSAALSGIPSYVSIDSDTTIDNLLALANGAPGGGAGSSGAAGTAGTVTAAVAASTCAFSPLGLFDGIGGQAGAAGGGGGAAGVSITLPVTGARMTGGAGGAGVIAADVAGGGFNATANTYLSEQRPAAAAAGSFDGCGGLAIWQPFMMFGGCGGAASNASIGGAGGPGAYGAGGGGGGCGTTAGRGGQGGNGIVIILSW
jgi:hypothetical protein